MFETLEDEGPRERLVAVFNTSSGVVTAGAAYERKTLDCGVARFNTPSRTLPVAMRTVVSAEALRLAKARLAAAAWSGCR